MVAKCGFCGGTGTRMIVLEPYGAPRRLGAVACGKCGAVLGVTDLPDAGAMLHHQAERLEGLRHHIEVLERQVGALSREIERIETHLTRHHGAP